MFYEAFIVVTCGFKVSNIFEEYGH